ncbi:alpha-ketoglutarate-dependent dioxygenase alkB homolog 6-like [Drosophila miranda]|uniref:alpha-ketoglutarate-dependent dioxygenase alkB homolog 6 n=1 Tax=Drosophila miranda TaxID=7229 RepID=UPI00143F12FF|nr:alpha-ketoglutarate-dependent dioxygenase alkB homolog 6 [Drosophila miranda]XP_033248445.1 alpha-ketoglutarate-dependent dioxygenase alkB homolog 6-like [Drosophila miranda]
MDFTGFEVRKCPPTAMYIPNFITSEEEQRILSHIERTPKPRWTQLLNRRLVNYGGVPHPNGMIAEEIPEWLQSYVDKVNNLGVFESQNANHVLVNEYLPGQGILPHTDGPLFYPIISTISCGAHTVLEFAKREGTTAEEGDASVGDGDGDGDQAGRVVLFKLLLEPRSLLILKDTLYSDYLHSIAETKEDVLCDRICNYDLCETTYKMGDHLVRRAPRISLTIRNVPKTSKMKLKFC